MIDAIHFGQKMYTVGGGISVNLAAAAAARKLQQPPVSWEAIWIKAIAIAAASCPELRTAYLPFPWPRLYTHPHPVACVAAERIWKGAPATFWDRFKNPATLPLAEIHRRREGMSRLPVESIGGFRLQIRGTRAPWIARRLMWHIAVQWSGRLRSEYIGTYSTAKTPQRVQVLFLTAPISFSFNWTAPAPNGDLQLRVFFDHRLIDATGVGRIVDAIAQAMNEPIAAELTVLARAGLKARASSGTR